MKNKYASAELPFKNALVVLPEISYCLDLEGSTATAGPRFANKLMHELKRMGLNQHFSAVLDYASREISDIAVHSYSLQIVGGRTLSKIDFDFLPSNGNEDYESMDYHMPEFETMLFTYRSYARQCQRFGLSLPEICLRNMCARNSDHYNNSFELGWLVMSLDKHLNCDLSSPQHIGEFDEMKSSGTALDSLDKLELVCRIEKKLNVNITLGSYN